MTYQGRHRTQDGEQSTSQAIDAQRGRITYGGTEPRHAARETTQMDVPPRGEGPGLSISLPMTSPGRTSKTSSR